MGRCVLVTEKRSGRFYGGRESVYIVGKKVLGMAWGIGKGLREEGAADKTGVEGNIPICHIRCEKRRA